MKNILKATLIVAAVTGTVFAGVSSASAHESRSGYGHSYYTDDQGRYSGRGDAYHDRDSRGWGGWGGRNHWDRDRDRDGGRGYNGRGHHNGWGY